MSPAGLLLALAAAGPTDLSWLSGQWRETKAEVTVEEVWTCPVGGILFGVGRTIRSGRVTSFEQMRIAPGPDGRPNFTAWPNGQPGATFPALSVEADRLVFTNASNDFPKAVTYARDGGALQASISAEPDGRTPAQSWRYAPR